MSLFEGGQFVAGENILPGVVLVLDTSSGQDFRVLVADTSEVGGVPGKEQQPFRIVGVAPTWSRRPNDFANSEYAAIAGEPLPVYRPGQVALVRAANNVSVQNGDVLIVHTASGPSDPDRGCVKPLAAWNGSGSPRDLVMVGYALHSAQGAAGKNNYVRVLLDIRMITNKQ